MLCQDILFHLLKPKKNIDTHNKKQQILRKVLTPSENFHSELVVLKMKIEKNCQNQKFSWYCLIFNSAYLKVDIFLRKIGFFLSVFKIPLFLGLPNLELRFIINGGFYSQLNAVLNICSIFFKKDYFQRKVHCTKEYFQHIQLFFEFKPWTYSNVFKVWRCNPIAKKYN